MEEGVTRGDGNQNLAHLAQVVDRRYNSLDRKMCNQSTSSLGKDYEAEPIKVLNGRDTRHQKQRQQNYQIDLGGQTLETNLNASRSPMTRKPQTAANGSSKRRNLKELIKLFQNNGVPIDENGNSSSIMKGETAMSQTRMSNNNNALRITATLDPNENPALTSHDKKFKVGGRTTMNRVTRAYTQMSGDYQSTGSRHNGNNQNEDLQLLDLRDEVSATAKLEKLKARYQKQVAAVNHHRKTKTSTAQDHQGFAV